MQLEVQHWKGVIRRVIAIICHLSERNLAFRGHTDVFFDPGNGNFLSQVELMAQFDPILNEHIRRIQTKEAKVYYLSSTIQNEIITLIGDKILQEILGRVKKAKYYSVIMDSTPDVIHTDQFYVVLRIVNLLLEPSSLNISVDSLMYWTNLKKVYMMRFWKNLKSTT